MIWTYVQFLLYMVPLTAWLARRAPVGVIAGIWFLMMCWEAYDMHADHALFYSALLFYAAYKAVHRPVTTKDRTSV